MIILASKIQIMDECYRSYQKSQSENVYPFVKMLLNVGFLNEERKLKLFDIDERVSSFEVVNLNLNHEPIVLTRMALYGIDLIIKEASDLRINPRN